jgi:hypothetical protein
LDFVARILLKAKFYDVKILYWVKSGGFDFTAVSELGAVGIY